MTPAGFLNFLKPPGMTSHDAVQMVRRVLGERRVGHAGTLDPAAAGVLVLGVGAATRLLEYAATGRKEYRAEVTFGLITTTQDAEGEIIAQQEAGWVDPDKVRAELPGLTGTIMQVPPLYSAVHHQGERLYKLARSGQHPEVPPRPVEVYDFRLLRWQGGPQPRALMHIACGPGTYVRSLAAELGERLGCGACLTFLVRVASSGFNLADALSPEELLQLGWQAVDPPGRGLAGLPWLRVGAGEAERLRHGRDLTLQAPLHDGDLVCLQDECGVLLAVGRVRQENGAFLAHPEKVFS